MVNHAVKLLVLSSLMVLIATPGAALAQHAGGGGGSQGGCGDVFGDLVHVLRDPVTGVPILMKRWVEDTGPGAVEPGTGEEEDPTEPVAVKIAYCPIALDAAGAEIGFLPLSCDFADPTAVVEVDYFGRLSAGRTKERNLRMHFDEVIAKIQESQVVSRDATGRLVLGTGCAVIDGDADLATCTWATIDSPLENLSLYHRLMKWGHIQTDPLEVDTWAHGDPALGTQYHPALRRSDYAKFLDDVRFLLPVHPRDAATCFAEGVTTCFAAAALTTQDFRLAASFVAAAADKTGRFTVDLVHYLNRILKITTTTPDSAATLPSLAAKIRDCNIPMEKAAEQDALKPPICDVYTADAAMAAPANERFVDFAAFQYERLDWFNYTVPALKPFAGAFVVDPAVPLMEWLADRNPGADEGTNVAGMVAAANDAVRAVEFVHNYEIPADLWDFSYEPLIAP